MASEKQDADNDNPEFKINIKSLDSVNTEIVAKKSDLIKTIKERYFEITGKPVDTQRLIFRGSELKNDQQLDYYGITKPAIIHIAFKTTYPTENDYDGYYKKEQKDIEEDVNEESVQEEIYEEAMKIDENKDVIKLSLADRLKDVIIDYQYQPQNNNNNTNKNQLQKYTSIENQTEYAQYQQLVQKLQSHEVLLYFYDCFPLKLVKYSLIFCFLQGQTKRQKSTENDYD